jgi:hypothetical protein
MISEKPLESKIFFFEFSFQEIPVETFDLMDYPKEFISF